MKRTPLPIKSFRLQNFKAVRDSGVVRFTPLTVFIGNNGSGKSSLIEGLETLQTIATDGLDAAMNPWHGFEQIWNQAVLHNLKQPTEGRAYHTNPLRFELRGNMNFDGMLSHDYYAMLEVNTGPGGNEIFLHRERFVRGPRDNQVILQRSTEGMVSSIYQSASGSESSTLVPYEDGFSILARSAHGIEGWQFLSLVPQEMGNPIAQKRTGRRIRLEKDGSNIAEYLLSIRRLDTANGTAIVDGIVETLQYVLPYARDVQPAITSELERTVYLQMTEAGFKLPGWLLSTGTLRILALLAVLRHPTPPPVLVVEEVENGLDPRTLNLLVEEIRYAVQSGNIQVILTTHSPYLLDLLTLSQIIVVERDDNDSPVFTRPADQEEMQEWVDKFSPGKLYTMSRLGRRNGR